MLKRIIHRIIVLSLASVVCWYIAKNASPWKGAAIWAGAMGVVVIVATFLLGTTKVGEVSWKNYLGGNAIPFGWQFCKGPNLWPAVVISWVIWALLGVAVAIILSPAHVSDPTAATGTGTSISGTLAKIILIFYWVVDGGAIMLLADRVFIKFGLAHPSGQRLLKMLLALVVMVAVSVLLYVAGHVVLAIIVAGAVPTLIGGLYGGFLIIIVTIGRKARWN